MNIPKLNFQRTPQSFSLSLGKVKATWGKAEPSPSQTAKDEVQLSSPADQAKTYEKDSKTLRKFSSGAYLTSLVGLTASIGVALMAGPAAGPVAVGLFAVGLLSGGAARDSQKHAEKLTKKASDLQSNGHLAQQPLFFADPQASRSFRPDA